MFDWWYMYLQLKVKAFLIAIILCIIGGLIWYFCKDTPEAPSFVVYRLYDGGTFWTEVEKGHMREVTDLELRNWGIVTVINGSNYTNWRLVH